MGSSRRATGLVAVTVSLTVSAARMAHAADLVTLATFDGENGAQPRAGLLRDAQGNLFGTTYSGGAYGGGTIFKLAPGATGVTTLTSLDFATGQFPKAGLIADSEGNLYGTTYDGGGATDRHGTIFVLHGGTSFDLLGRMEGGLSGINPTGRLSFHADGGLIGTAYGGSGTIFRSIGESSSGLSIVHEFGYPDASKGTNPLGGLVADAVGNLYGTASVGGPGGRGTVFKFDRSGELTALAMFDGANGANPQAGVICDAAGNIYGTTAAGGEHDFGTVFRVDGVTNQLTTLVSFDYANGQTPLGALLADVAGNLYGTTEGGGSHGYGTVFRIEAGSNTLTTLFSFDNGDDGAHPVSDLIADPLGNLYGTAEGGGANGKGTIFKISNAGFISLVADADGDNRVDFDDLVVLAQHYGQSGQTWSSGDFTHDGAVNFDDLVLLAQRYGQNLLGEAGEAGTSGAGGSSTDFAADWALAQSLAPEPGTTAMLSASLIAIARRRRRVDIE